MKAVFAALLALITLENSTSANTLEFRSSIADVSAPLTTEAIWALEPRELNPHRKRWVVERNVALDDLAAFQRPDKRHGARALRLVAHSRIHHRGPGPWYREMSEFPCTQEADDRFSTHEGTRAAAIEASAAWHDTLKAMEPRLVRSLAAISQSTPDAATSQARLAFRDWLASVDAEWSVRGASRAQIREWRTYLEIADREGLCKVGRNKKRGLEAGDLPWEKMMEPPPAVVRQPTEPARMPIARAPAKKWSGLYTVRASIEVAGSELTGQFLIDSGSAVSALAPSWLRAQGVNPEALVLPGSKPVQVAWTGGSSSGDRVFVAQFRIGGVATDQREFILLETDLFAPPAHLSTCCDGILGTDFLRRYAVEFIPGTGPSVVLWDRAGYSPEADYTWLEVRTRPSGDVISDRCVVGPGIPGVRWDTGSEMALDIHTPWIAHARKSKTRWDINCPAGLWIARPGEASYLDGLGLNLNPAFHHKHPGTNIGMEVLGRGAFVFDLSHGRLWLEKDALKRPVRVNLTGLELVYRRSAQGDRELRVVSVRPSGVSAPLARAGLKAGMKIAELDARQASKMDIYEVEQRLAGAYGDKVTVDWEFQGGKRRAIAIALVKPAPVHPEEKPSPEPMRRRSFLRSQ